MNTRVLTRVILPPVILGVVVLSLWQLVVTVFEIPAYLVPGPLAIGSSFGTNVSSILNSSMTTGLNALVGLLVGAVLGVLIAILASVLRILDWMIAPIVAAMAVIPIVALAPVFYSMFGASVQTGRQMVAALAVFVPMFVNTLNGLRQIKPVQRDLMRAYAATTRQTTRVLALPAAVPHTLNGLKIGSSLAVISALVAEYFGGPANGLGRAITTAVAGSNYTLAWAYVLGSVILGLVFYMVTAGLEKISLRHRGDI